VHVDVLCRKHERQQQETYVVAVVAHGERAHGMSNTSADMQGRRRHVAATITPLPSKLIPYNDGNLNIEHSSQIHSNDHTAC
jgi:hypothetical protein